MSRSPGVDETLLQKHREFLSLLVGETSISAVGLGILDIDLFVRDIHVSADHHALACLEAENIFTERIVPGHSVVEPLQAVLRIGGIDADEEEIRHFQSDYPPL